MVDILIIEIGDTSNTVNDVVVLWQYLQLYHSF